MTLALKLGLTSCAVFALRTRCVSGQAARFVYHEQGDFSKHFPHGTMARLRLDAFVVLMESSGEVTASTGKVRPGAGLPVTTGASQRIS